MQTGSAKPNLKKRLFWEYDFEHINWREEAAGIIGRVIERGTHDEWEELVKYYGRVQVIDILKNSIKFLPDEIITDVSEYFEINPRDMQCYTSKQSRKGHWI